MRAMLARIVPAFLLALVACNGPPSGEYRTLNLDEYRDLMKAGWIGQMVGVGWGGPTEFKYRGRTIPEDEMPAWKPELVNQFQQDDIYVEMTFLRTLEVHGLDVSSRQAGIDFANSGYKLWHASRAGRSNLRKGIAPPDSSNPQFNRHADDIDYQIEADFSGLVSPGLPNRVIALGEVFGRLMCHGDGLYGGLFVGGMYAEAFFETDMEKIVRAGLACIPEESEYARCIRDVLGWWKEYPDDWQMAWGMVNEKYHKDADHRRASCEGPRTDLNIDAKINGAFIVLGLLYGERDPDRTISIATRCGQDSDCNPANAGGILFTTIGFSSLPERFKSALDPETVFSHTSYGFDRVVEVCEQLARASVVDAGGEIEAGAMRIPVEDPAPGPCEQCWDPKPVVGSRFTEEELARIERPAVDDIDSAVRRFAPGWRITCCGTGMDPGLQDELRGRGPVLVTHPLDRKMGCTLSRWARIAEGVKATLSLAVGHHEQGDWLLIVRADGRELLRTIVGPDTSDDGWMDIDLDLSEHGGREILLELENHPTGWKWEGGYWAKIELRAE